MKSANYWIDRLGLQPHPEGGYFREVYRSADQLYHPVHSGKRELSTSIYFLLEGDNISHLHQLESDELWYFHDGKGAVIHIFNEGEYTNQELSLSDKGSPQILIPKKSQFAAEVIGQEGFVLMGCMVSPGFDFEDFRMLNKVEMEERYPAYRELIDRLCIK